MKILFLHNYFHIKSGSNSIMFQEAELLKKNGHGVYYFCTDKKPYYDENYEFLEYFPKHIDFKNLSFLEKITNFYKPFYNPEAVKKLGMFLDKIKPDIIHEHTTSFHLTPAVLNECYKRKIPVILTIHGPGFLCPSGTLMLGQKKLCEKIYCKGLNKHNCLINKCIEDNLINKLFKISIYSFYEMMGFYKRISAFICPGESFMDFTAKTGINKNKLNLIQNFAGKKYLEIQPEFKTNNSYFLYVGRLEKEKGVNFLTNAAKLLPEEIEIHLVGNGSEKDLLKRFAEKHSLRNIKFQGFKSGLELEEEYRNCIASILPSNCFEAFGLTIVESFCFGKPVIASNIGGITEIIDNYENGILIKPGNVEELANAIKFLYENPKKAIEFGINGRKKTELLFIPEIHYEKLIKLYSKVVKENK